MADNSKKKQEWWYKKRYIVKWNNLNSMHLCNVLEIKQKNPKVSNPSQLSSTAAAMLLYLEHFLPQ